MKQKETSSKKKAAGNAAKPPSPPKPRGQRKRKAPEHKGSEGEAEIEGEQLTKKKKAKV